MRTQPLLGKGRLSAFIVVMLLSASASAQVDTGSILGTVKDQSGGVLPGATVTITHEGQALTLTTVTRGDGTYIFTPIRTGAYAIDVEFPRKVESYTFLMLDGSRLIAHRDARTCVPYYTLHETVSDDMRVVCSEVLPTLPGRWRMLRNGEFFEVAG